MTSATLSASMRAHLVNVAQMRLHAVHTDGETKVSHLGNVGVDNVGVDNVGFGVDQEGSGRGQDGRQKVVRGFGALCANLGDSPKQGDIMRPVPSR